MRSLVTVIVLFLLQIIFAKKELSHPHKPQEPDSPLFNPEYAGKLNAIPDIARTFLVNAKYRIDRLQEMRERLEQLHVPFTRFEAVEFKTDVYNYELLREIHHSKFHNQTKFDVNLAQMNIRHRKDITWEKIGRWQTHFQIYLDITLGDSLMYTGPFLIVEDNAEISERTLKYLTKDYLFKTLPKDWDLLLVDTLLYTCQDEIGIPAEQLEHRFCRAKTAFSIHAYVIKDTDAAYKLVTLFNTRSPRISDWYMSKLFEQGKLIAYIPEPNRNLAPTVGVTN